MRPTYSVIIAGGRTFNDYDLLAQSCDHYLSDKFDTHNIEIVSGTANGADKLGELYSAEIELAEITKNSLKRFPANWDKYGNSAGYKRNKQMAKHADALIAFWDGASRGTMHMINIMNDLDKPVRVVKYKEAV